MIKNKDNQNGSNKNKEDEIDIRKSTTLQIRKKLNNNQDNARPINEKKFLNKTNNSLAIMNRSKNENKESNLTIKNRLLYEKMKKKLILNNNTNIYNNHHNIKFNVSNYNDKAPDNLNKTFNSNLTNNIFKNNLNLNNSVIANKKSDKKLSKYAAKINNYYNNYNNYTLINSDLKNIANKYAKNFDIIKKKRGSIPDNTKLFAFNFNKYISSSSKIHASSRSKKNQIKGSFYRSSKNNCSIRERKRTFTVNTNISKEKEKNLSYDTIMNSYSEMKDKKDKIITIFKKNKNISSREGAYYLLSTSPILRLCERLIFSRASPNVKKVITTSTILKNHIVFLNDKANELKSEIELCEKRLKTPFVASKIADITLNFITSLDEQEFQEFDIYETNEEDINLYYNYIRLLYLLFNMNYDNDCDGKKLKNNLIETLKDKGFKYIRDYLYYIYIARKEENNIVEKIDIINNEIIKKDPKILDYHETFKICRFLAFTNYLIKEIINYANNIKDVFLLKIKAQNFLDIVLDKIDKMQNINKKKKQRQGK
jgi:hypothetical protein